MKIIFKIAKAELRNLFYSPIAWLIILVFYILCGFQFVNPLVDVARIQEANVENDPNWYGFANGLSFSLFTKSIKNMIENIYLFIPLLTMGVINREVNSGTLKLLYSSPIRTRDIVFGKYLGLLLFSFVLLAIVAILFAMGGFTIIHAEINWYLAIWLSTFLVVSTYLAAGLFISCLTSYQVVAGLLTFVVFFILQALREVWQEYDFFRDITYFLSITNKAEYMISGLITTRDILYFILIITMFLSFALIKLKSTQESKSWKVSFSRYAIVSVTILILGYFSSRPGYVGYLDVTRNKMNSLHPATQSVLKELDGSPLTITLYTNILGRTPQVGLPRARNNYVWDYWEKFVQYYPNIKYRYEYYYDVNENNSMILKSFPNKSIREVAESVAEVMKVDLARFKSPEEIRKIVDMSREDMGPVMELEYKGKKEFLRTYMDMKVMPDQVHVSGTIRRLVRTTPKIMFTSGHYERSPYRFGEREFGYTTCNKGSRQALINLGVDVDTLSLKQNDIPADLDVLVVADPKSELDPVEKNKIIQHLSNGGNALFYGEPGKQQVLNPILETIGIKLDNGVLVNPPKYEMANIMYVYTTDTGSAMAQERGLYAAVKSKTSAAAIVQGAVNINYKEINGFKVEPIYGLPHKETKAWIENGLFVADSAAPVFSEQEGDVVMDYYTVGVQLTRTINNKVQRIMVSGDADFMTPKRTNGGAIKNGMFSWTLNNEYPVYTNYPDPIDVKVRIGFATSRIIYVVYVYVIPAIILLGAIVLIVRRKRK